MLRDPGGGWPLAACWTTWRNPASTARGSDRELVPPGRSRYSSPFPAISMTGGRLRGALPSRLRCAAVTRPRNFEHYRWLGDKRSQVVYDLDADDLDQELIDELLKSEQFTAFGPDTLAEARNRNY